MSQHPSVYADLLGKKISEHDVDCWLINTGWTGGPFGEGHRIEIAYTRAMVNAALEDKLGEVSYVKDPIFGVQIPTSCPGVPSDLLIPKQTWSDAAAYDAQAYKLASMFVDNFSQFEEYVPDSVRSAGPIISQKI
jgi:phosphoenolpyruvate carboxykinase (ATP)